MEEVRIVVPFTYSGSYVPPRKRNAHQSTVSSTVEVTLHDAGGSGPVPLASCRTERGCTTFSRVGDRIVRPLAGPDGSPVGGTSIASLVADPGTALSEWIDYPFPRSVRLHHSWENAAGHFGKDRKSKASIRREDPRGGTSRELLDVRDWLEDDRGEKEMECHAATAGLVLSGGCVMRDDVLPMLEFDLKSSVPQFVLRTSTESAENRILEPSRTTSYGSKVESEIVRIPLADLPIVADVLEASDPTAAGELRSSLEWAQTAPPPGEDVELLRGLGAAGISRFVKDVGFTYVRDFTPTALRRVAGLLDAHADHAAGRMPADAFAEAAISFASETEGKRPRSDATTMFLLRLAAAVERMRPAAAAEADAASLETLFL